MARAEFLLLTSETKLAEFGFKVCPGGAHISRTMMLEEITALMSAVQGTAGADQYRRAAIEENVIRKATRTTREKTYRHLRELYGLSPQIPLFAIYRELLQFDRASAPLLSLLVAWTRDPLLRGTTKAILNTPEGIEVAKERVQQALTEAFPSRYSPLNIAKIARNAASTWTQSGHLAGKYRKVRQRVKPKPAAVALALLLGHVLGLHGEELFRCDWCKILDISPSEAASLAFQAHRESLLNMRKVGSVVEISFPRFHRFLEPTT
jgi:hypothetical protein